jgi:hypothetical protein
MNDLDGVRPVRWPVRVLRGTCQVKTGRILTLRRFFPRPMVRLCRVGRTSR